MKQIFKSKVPVGALFALLDKFCMDDNNCWVVDMNAYRKATYHSDDKQRFLDSILPHYHASKQFYVTRKFTYNSMVNLIRQICKSNDVAFTNKLKYDHSDYTIVYYMSKPAPAAAAANRQDEQTPLLPPPSSPSSSTAIPVV